MKIVLTVHQFFPDCRAGTEVLTLAVATELIRRGHQVVVFSGHAATQQIDDEARFEECSFQGVPVFRFHHAFVPMGGQEVVAELEHDNHLANKYFTDIVERVKPDAIHFFHFGRLGMGLIDVACAFDIPAYYTPTDFWWICPTNQLMLADGQACSGPRRFAGNCVKHVAALTSNKVVAALAPLVPDAIVDVAVRVATVSWLPKHRLMREADAVFKRADFNIHRLNALQRIFSPSGLMTETLVSRGIKPEIIAETTFGIDVSSYSENPWALKLDRVATFGFIGTLSRHKGCHILLAAFKRLKIGSARLLIYGDLSQFPDYSAHLLALAEGSEFIEFRGTFPNASIAGILVEMDALVVPSLWHENTPLVIFSALAAKCPVICSSQRGMTELVSNGINGFVFESENILALQSVLQQFIDDRRLAARLSANCEKPKSIEGYVDELVHSYYAGLPPHNSYFAQCNTVRSVSSNEKMGL